MLHLYMYINTDCSGVQRKCGRSSVPAGQHLSGKISPSMREHAGMRVSFNCGHNHTPEGMFANAPGKTLWMRGTTANSRAAMIREVLSKGTQVTDTANKTGIVMELKFARQVGTQALKGGRLQPLNTLRVYYDPASNFV